MKRLRTVAQVFEALGGVAKVAEITDSNFKQAWSWLGVADQFPANTYVVLQRTLKQRGYEAPARLWAMKGLKKAA